MAGSDHLFRPIGRPGGPPEVCESTERAGVQKEEERGREGKRERKRERAGRLTLYVVFRVFRSEKEGDSLIMGFKSHEESVYGMSWSACDAWVQQ